MHFGRLIQGLAPDLHQVGIAQLCFASLLLLQLLFTDQLALLLNVLNSLQ